MSSREIAALTGKEHKHVLTDIRTMIADLELDEPGFRRIYLDTMNRQQTEFVLDRELTETLLTGYSTPLRRKVIARWRELEAKAVIPAGAPVIDDEVTKLSRLRASGVMSQYAAECAGFMLLGLKPPREARSPSAPRQSKPLPMPVTAPAPAKKHLKITVTKPLALSFDDGIQLVLTEVSGYVGGGYETLTAVMVSRGLLSPSLQPTASGKEFISSKSPRGNHWRVSALLRHLSA